MVGLSMFTKLNLLSCLLISILISLSGCGGGGGGEDGTGPIVEPFLDQNAFRYFPVNSNATWTYSADNSMYRDQNWWLEDAGEISGYKAYALTRDTGTKEYYVSNETGVYLIGLYLPRVSTNVGEFIADIKFDELIPILTQEMIDDFYSGNWSYYSGEGSVDIFPNYGLNDLTFTASHQYNGDGICDSDECLTNFDTKRMYLNIDMVANIEGNSITLPLTFYADLAEGIGYTEFRQDYKTLYLSSLSGIDIPTAEVAE